MCSLSQHLCCARALLETGNDGVAFDGVFSVAADQQEWVLKVVRSVTARSVRTGHNGEWHVKGGVVRESTGSTWKMLEAPLGFES